MKQATVTSTSLDVFAESPLPLDWLMLSTCVYGVSGAGKSTFSRRVAEQVHAVGERFCTVDWKGDWSGLRTSADGAGEGLPVVIFGGKQGDFPLEKEAGASLGAAVAARPQSTILDLSRMNLTDRPFFLARFFEALFHHNSEPLFLINDECHNYVPQVGRSGRGDDDDVRRCLNAAITIAKEGRGRALGRMYVTQRAPGLHTDVREIAEALVAFRSTGKNDKVRVREWLEDSFDGDELVAAVRSLPSLEDGECLFASSNKLIRQCGTRRALMPTTFDSSRTPRLGERRREPVKRSAPDLAAFRKALGEELEKQKSEDPELLRQQVKSLTAERDELAARLDGAVAPGPPERIEIPVETPALVDWKKLAAHFERVADIEIERLRTAICNVIVDGEVMFSGTHVPRVFEDSPRPSPLPVSVQPRGETLKEKAAGVGHRDVKPGKIPDDSLGAVPKIGRCERAVLTAIAQRHPKTSTRARVAILSGYSANSSSFANAIGALRSTGWIEGSSDALNVTREGFSAAGALQPEGRLPKLPKGSELRKHWEGKLERAERILLQVLAGAPGCQLSKAKLSDLSGYSITSSSFANAIGKLRTLELVSRGEPIRMSEELA